MFIDPTWHWKQRGKRKRGKRKRGKMKKGKDENESKEKSVTVECFLMS